MVEILNPGIRNFLEQFLGHTNPFLVEELVTITTLTANHLKSLANIEYFPNLETLEIYFSELAGLEDLIALEKLTNLTICASTIDSVAALAECKNLETVQFNLTSVEDLSVVFGLSNLKSALILGNPLTPDFYAKLQTFSPKSRLLLHIPCQQDWEFTRTIWESGIRVCFSSIDDVQRVIVKPGLPTFTKAVGDFIFDSEFAVEALLASIIVPHSVPTLSTLFNVLDDNERNNQERLFRLNSGHIIGDQDQAISWIQNSSLAHHIQQDLLQFVTNFPGLPFYYETHDLWEELESLLQISAPSWFISIRAVLAFALPDQKIQVKFRDWVGDQIGDSYWYELNNFAIEEDLVAEGNNTFLVIGESPQNLSRLAINIATPNDYQVYEYNREDIRNPSSGYITTIFRSYSEMLSNIDCVRLPTNNEIKARDMGQAFAS